MRILFEGQYPSSEDGPFTGPMRVLYALSRAIASLPGCEVTVYTPHRMRDLLKKPEEFSLPGHGVKAVRMVYGGMLGRGAVSGFDIIHVHGVSLFNTLPLVRKRKTPPILYTAHGLVAVEKELGYAYGRTMASFERRLIFLSDHISTVSEDAKRLILETYAVPEEKVTVIPNGVDTYEFTPYKSRTAPSPRAPLMLLFIGDLVPAKGLAFLFQALEKLRDIPLIVKLAGRTTDYFQELQAQFSDLFSAGRIQTLGYLRQNELKNAITEADLLVLPSSYEQCGQVVLEAMAMARPVIVSDRVGLRDAVIRGKCGYVIPYGDADALSERIATLARRPALRRELGRNAETAARTHDWKRVAEKYRALYIRMTGGLQR